MKQPVVKQDEAKPVPVEILAESIKTIAENMRKLRSGPLNDRALLLLIQGASRGKVGQREIKNVFEAIDNLERTYLRRAK